MKLSNELVEEAKKCKTAEEISALAKQNNIELAVGEAKEIFRVLNANGELSDEELGNVAAGSSRDCESSGETPKYKVGQQCGYFKSGIFIDSVEYGVIQKVSDERKGTFFPAFVYTIKNDDGGANDEVYESYIFKAE